jgi:SAM-dependent methyltransferase
MLLQERRTDRRTSSRRRLKRLLRPLYKVYRDSKVLPFIIRHTKEALSLRLDPQKVADEAHLVGAWNFESPIERTWQRNVLGVVERHLENDPWGRTLEIGCSEGVFTAQLAQQCLSVDGFDISPVSLARAGLRCRRYPNVQLRRLDIAAEEIPGQYDLVFLMDVLWYVVGRNRQAGIAARVAGALRDGGLFVFSDSRMPKWVRHPFWSLFLPTGADGWMKLLQACPDLKMVYKESYPADGRSTPEFWEKLFVVFRKEPAGAA